MRQLGQETYLNTDEVADRVKCHRKTVTVWCKTGVLPGEKVGRDWLIPLTALDGFKPPRRGRPPKSGEETETIP